MNKRLYCLILSLILLLTMLGSTITVSAEIVDVQEVTLSMFSNVAPDISQITGFYKNNTFYVDINMLADISRAKIENENDRTVCISTNSGAREYEIFFDKQILIEKNCEAQNITMPSIIIDDIKCISVLHFLRYIGANVQLDNSASQLKIFIRYNIFDAIADCSNNDIGNYFWWDEVDYGDKSIEDKLINAGVVALINKESNIFKMMFNAEGIARESVEDVLISIIQNEGQNSINDSTDIESLNNLNDLYNIEVDVVGFILEAYKSDATKNFAEFIDEFSSVSSFASSAIVNVLNLVESVKQFDNISEAQLSLMQNTILKHSSDSPLLCGEWDIVLDAAKNINTRVQDEYANTYSASYNLLEKIAHDTLKVVTEVKEPVTLAWDTAITAMKSIPYTSNMIDKKTQLYNAYNCSIIQCIANELFVKVYSDLYYNDYFYSQPSFQLDHLNQMKSDLILQYKSTLTTREYLISSNFLTEDYANLMLKMNQETAILLNKLENCAIVCVGLEPVVDEDITWLEELENNDAGNSSELTFEQAKAIAKDYWDLSDYETTTEEGTKVAIFGTADDVVESNGIKYYCFTYRALIEDGAYAHWTTWDQVFVNLRTGEYSYELTMDGTSSPNEGNQSVTITDDSSAEDLRKAIIGEWYDPNFAVNNYAFFENGSCKMMFSDAESGTFEITADKTLKITMPWTTKKLKWDSNCLYSSVGWYFTSDGNLIIEGDALECK